jgi:hypothetical protein
LIEPPKQKSHRQFSSGGGILELLAMSLEYLAPGARRRTNTAGTTEASLLGLLDVGNHRLKVQNGGSKVNEAIGWRRREASSHFPNHIPALVEQDEDCGEALRAESVIMSYRPAGSAPEMPAGIQ